MARDRCGGWADVPLARSLPRRVRFAALLLLSVSLASAVSHADTRKPSDAPVAADDAAEHKRAAAFTTSMAAKSKDAPADRETLPGAATYHARCAGCHEGQVPKAPIKTFVQFMAPDMIYAALTTGVMQRQAAGLSAKQKEEVAEYLTGEHLGAALPAAPPACSGAAQHFDLTRQPRIHGWGFDERNSHMIPGDVAQLAAADVPRLKLKWAFAYPGALRARSRPTLAFGALYVGSQSGTVYALDAATGCLRWSQRVAAEVRTPIIVAYAAAGEKPAAQPLVFFGDIVGHVYALDAQTGKPRWQIRADDHPSATITGAPAYYAGRLYVAVSSLEETMVDPGYACCTFRGSVLALDAASGKQIWRGYTIDEPAKPAGTKKSGARLMAPSGAPIWSSPTIDTRRGLIYVGTGNNYSAPSNDRSSAVLAFDLATGRLRWSWQAVGHDAWNVGCMLGNDNCPKEPGPDYDMGSGTMLIKGSDGRERILAGLKSGMAFALDPDKHDEALWRTNLGRGSIQGGIQFGMASDGQRLYVPIADMADSHDGKVYKSPPKPGLYALDLTNGNILWSSPTPDVCGGRQFCDPGILASIVAIPGSVFAGHEDGRIRAYDSGSGKVVWQYDTTQEVSTLSGAKAHGGSVGGGGPVVYDGVVYMNSGYGLYFHMPGNLLLAFSVDGK